MIRIDKASLDFSTGFHLFIDKLSVKKGEIFTIIGPNAAGKSTLLNVIALFQELISGEVELFGENAGGLNDRLSLRRRMSFVFSKPYLLNDTVYNNVCLPLKLRRMRNTSYADEMLRIFKINELRNLRASRLSQGQSQRVALARAFVTQPELLLLDEPFLSLDIRYKEPLITELQNIIKSNKITAVFVTQDRTEALSFADTMAVMENGRILQQGRPEEIFTRPVSKEAADFVGMETIVEGVIFKKEDNLCYLKAADKDLAVVSECDKGDKVFICIRPEDVVISRYKDTESSARNCFKARIINIEPWRMEYKLNLDCGFNLAAYLTRQSVEGLCLETGQEVFVYFKATAAHLIKR